MKKLNAFTLAEVLITLGIIGVVAAMTMPTLMNSTQGAQYKTAYKKALSVLSQAVVLNVALDDYDLSQATEADSVDTNKASLYALFTNRMNVVRDNSQSELAKSWGKSKDSSVTKEIFGNTDNYTLFFNDGIVFTFPKDAVKCTDGNSTDSSKNHCRGAIDVNGEKNPNLEVECDDRTSGDACTVGNPRDIYPVEMYDQTILPVTDAGRAVLYGAGN